MLASFMYFLFSILFFVLIISMAKYIEFVYDVFVQIRVSYIIIRIFQKISITDSSSNFNSSAM